MLVAKCTNCLFVQERNDVMWIVDWLPGKIEQDFDIVTNMLPGPNTFQVSVVYFLLFIVDKKIIFAFSTVLMIYNMRILHCFLDNGIPGEIASKF